MDAGSDDTGDDNDAGHDATLSDAGIDSVPETPTDAGDGSASAGFDGGTSTQEPNQDAGVSTGEDAGLNPTDPCEAYVCESGYECVVEWFSCELDNTDAGLIDAGACVPYEVYCVVYEDGGQTSMDAGFTEGMIDSGSTSISHDSGQLSEGTLDGGSDSITSGLDAGGEVQFDVQDDIDRPDR